MNEQGTSKRMIALIVGFIISLFITVGFLIIPYQVGGGLLGSKELHSTVTALIIFLIWVAYGLYTLLVFALSGKRGAGIILAIIIGALLILYGIPYFVYSTHSLRFMTSSFSDSILR